MEKANMRKEYILNKYGLKIKVTSNRPSEKTLDEFANKCIELCDKIKDRKGVV